MTLTLTGCLNTKMSQQQHTQRYYTQYHSHVPHCGLFFKEENLLELLTDSEGRAQRRAE